MDRISRLASKSGRDTYTCRSNLPGLSRAGSWESVIKLEGLYDDVGTIGCSDDSDIDKRVNPVHLTQQLAQDAVRNGRACVVGASFCANCIKFILSKHSKQRTAGVMESTKKMIDGAAIRAFLNISRTAFSESPTHLLKSSGPLTARKFSPDSVASALASKVLLQPGGP